MTPQELKNSILQRAMEGKLVDQRPEEGSGEELYKLIQEEKNKLIKEGKIKKQKALPEITEEEITFDIPESWKWVRISDCIDVRDGTHGTPKYVEEGYPLITSKNLKNGNIDFSNCKFISREDHLKISERSRVDVNDILFAMIGSIGNPVKVQVSNEFSIKNMALFKSIRNYFNMDYLYWFLYSSQYDMRKIAYGAVQSFVSLKFLREYLFPIPPLAEQKRIVEKIEDLMPLVDEYEKNWQKLEDLNKKFPEDMKKSILQEAIKGKLVEQRPEEGSGEDLYKLIQEEKKKLIKEGKIKKQKVLPEITEEEIPFDIPESWKWVRLGEISDFQGGYAFKSSSYVQKSRNQVIRLGNVKQNNLLTDIKSVFISDDLAKEAENYRIKKNDILVTMTGTRRKKDYFFVTLIKENDISEKKLFLNQRVGCFRLNKNTYFEYILKVLQSNLIRDIIFEKETGTANQGNLGSEDIKMYIYIPLPPLAEQKRIVEKLEELLPLCDQLIEK